MSKEVAAALGQQVRAHRQAQGLSREQLAELSGLSPTYISEVECGRKEPSVQTLLKLATGMGCALADLTASVEPRVQGRITKFELLRRLERVMQAHYTEEQAEEWLARMRGEKHGAK